MTRREALTQAGSWSLSAVVSHGVTWHELCGLRVWPWQFSVLARQPGRGAFRISGTEGGGQRMVLDHVQVTPEESACILGGRHPLNVLLPPLRARPLTLEELMAR